MSTLCDIDGCKLTFKDRKLQVIAEVTHGLEDLSETLVVADVIANKVGIAHERFKLS